jgi:hypothetical protein
MEETRWHHKTINDILNDTYVPGRPFGFMAAGALFQDHPQLRDEREKRRHRKAYCAELEARRRVLVAMAEEWRQGWKGMAESEMTAALGDTYSTLWQVTTTTTYQSGPQTVTTQTVTCPASPGHYDFCGPLPPSPDATNAIDTQRTSPGFAGFTSP